MVKVEGVTWNAGIRNGDQLLAINGQKVADGFEAQTILNKVVGGDYAKYIVEKADGRIITTNVYIKKLIQYGNLANSLSALFWMIIGFIVLLISSFLPVRFFGFLVVVSIFSCLVGALILIPSLCIVLRPKFLEPKKINTQTNLRFL